MVKYLIIFLASVIIFEAIVIAYFKKEVNILQSTISKQIISISTLDKDLKNCKETVGSYKNQIDSMVVDYNLKLNTYASKVNKQNNEVKKLQSIVSYYESTKTSDQCLNMKSMLEGLGDE